MKVITLLFAVAGLSSCVPKPYMVGSLNDQKSPPDLEDISEYVTTTKTTTAVSGGASAHGHGSAKQPRESLNPVNHTSSNPLR
jgi:hypothetical protein